MKNDGSPIVRIVITLENPIFTKTWMNECIALKTPIQKKLSK